MNRGLFSFAALLFVGRGLNAQPPRRDFISVCSVDLELGMAQSTVLPQLSKSCRPKQVIDEGTWSLSSPQDPDNIFGLVEFRGGKLYSIIKNWYWYGQGGQPYDFAAALCSVFDHFKEEGQTTCSFETHRKEIRGAVARGVALTCGRKIISIAANSFPTTAPDVVVTEELAEDNH